MLSEARFEQIIRNECMFHNVNTEYFLRRMRAKSRPSNALEVVKTLDDMMADTYFTNYEEMYSGVPSLPDDHYI